MEQSNKSRYARQYTLQDFGKQGQTKLAEARVLIVGAGGLGCPVLQYLCAAGVGDIGIVDADKVGLSNLHRQPLYRTTDVGRLKAEVAAAILRAQNDTITVVEYAFHLNNQNAWDLISSYDIIVDCTDNFETRYVLCDVCALLHKPLVYGAIYTYEGQVAVFNVSDSQGIRCQYRDLFPVPPSSEEAPDCATTGVLGVLPGVIGLLQANEVIKLLAGIGEPLINKLYTIGLLDYQSVTIRLQPQHHPDAPESRIAFEAANYGHYCGSVNEDVGLISSTELDAIAHRSDSLLIDVRALDELPRLSLPHRAIPLELLMANVHELNASHLVLICQSGVRSARAAESLKNYLGNRQSISHLQGGILAYQSEKNDE
ncbi:HesA/MoeB/ThiF family protein [Sphingobacterium chungjuense]|uniref:HesA/MoeB/ThiF family protein n=1 Tax=Sphingobacterium chungjuense TaxID=2675553 RepID=UPI001409ECEF|nr:HesA/MoeB/ThiF family protein [Sphingobacterium chungjuense]